VARSRGRLFPALATPRRPPNQEKETKTEKKTRKKRRRGRKKRDCTGQSTLEDILVYLRSCEGVGSKGKKNLTGGKSVRSLYSRLDCLPKKENEEGKGKLQRIRAIHIIRY